MLTEEFKAGRNIKMLKAAKDALMIYFDNNEMVV
jgi:hypothetical protein